MNDSGAGARPVGIVLCGATGRMGSTIARLAAGDGRVRILGGIDREGASSGSEALPQIRTIGEAAELVRAADVIIDFSAPAFLNEFVSAHRTDLGGKGIVVGTTGLGSAENALLEELSTRSPVIAATNYSVGVALLVALVEQAAAVLGTEYDVEIVEAHHRRKEDAPSGTALTLGEAVAKARGQLLDDARRDGRSGRPGARPAGEIGFHAMRGGEVVGEHVVHFIGDNERIELVHRAADRSLFAQGALRAARWIAGKEPGRYTVRNVLGL